MRRAIADILTGEIVNIAEVAEGVFYLPPEGMTLLDYEATAHDAVAEIGDTWDGVSLTKARAAPAERAALLARVNSMREAKIAAGIEVEIGGLPCVLQTRQADRENIDRAALGASLGYLPLNADGSINSAGNGTHISWRMRDNSDVLMDGPTFITNVAVPLGLHINACHLAARKHKALIGGAPIEDLASYDLESGWPAVAQAE